MGGPPGQAPSQSRQERRQSKQWSALERRAAEYQPDTRESLTTYLEGLGKVQTKARQKLEEMQREAASSSFPLVLGDGQAEEGRCREPSSEEDQEENLGNAKTQVKKALVLLHQAHDNLEETLDKVKHGEAQKPVGLLGKV